MRAIATRHGRPERMNDGDGVWSEHDMSETGRALLRYELARHEGTRNTNIRHRERLPVLVFAPDTYKYIAQTVGATKEVPTSNRRIHHGMPKS